MPYLPIDPKDLGRSYEAVIRVNSQSGKGGISYLLESEYGLELPRRLQIEFSQVVQHHMDASGKELTAQNIWALFEQEYRLDDTQTPIHRVVEDTGAAGNAVQLDATIAFDGQSHQLSGQGSGPIDAFVAGLQKITGSTIRVIDYHQHAIGAGADARSVAYVEVQVDGGKGIFGTGIDANIVSASLKAILSGVARARRTQPASTAEPIAG